MVKNRNLFNVPAMISEPSNPITFEVKEFNKFVSLVQLKVFYQGITPDNREFTEDFSRKVLASLPQTPVVAYHDGEDFIGHNSEQYVYGYVPEVGEIGFEEIDGQKWAVTDIILFTGRDDNIGEVASKIFNKQHSLELSDNTSYAVQKDESGNSKLVFLDTDGVVGLSVLGDHQEPGFTGSEFFIENEQTLASLIRQYAEIKEQDLLPLNFTESFKSGGAVMDLKQTIAHLNEFMKATFDEIYVDVQTALLEQNDLFYIMDISDNMVVYMDFNDGTYHRATYERTEEGVAFGAAETVKVRFLTDEEIDTIFEKAEETDFEDNGGDDTGDGTGDGNGEGDDDGNDDGEGTGDGEGDGTGEGEGEGETDPENGEEGEGEGEGDDENGDDGADQDLDVDDLEDEKKKIVYVEVPQFNEEEMEQLKKDMKELNEYRRKDKEKIIEDFSQYLTEEEKAFFLEEIDNYTGETLEQEMSVIAMQKIREAKDKEEFGSVNRIQVLSHRGNKRKSERDELARLVAENK